jgi:hypothetical protein
MCVFTARFTVWCLWYMISSTVWMLTVKKLLTKAIFRVIGCAPQIFCMIKDNMLWEYFRMGPLTYHCQHSTIWVVKILAVWFNLDDCSPTCPVYWSKIILSSHSTIFYSQSFCHRHSFQTPNCYYWPSSSLLLF